jgi:hypothetical protein
LGIFISGLVGQIAVLTAQIQFMSVSNLADIPDETFETPMLQCGLVARSNMASAASKQSRKPQLAYIDPDSGIESANGSLPVEFVVVESAGNISSD